MAYFSHFWVLTLLLVTVLQLACSQSDDGRRVTEDLPSLLPALRKLLEQPALNGKISVSNPGTWCVPKDGVPDPQLQGNLDYACGHGADCGPIQSGRPCFEPNTVRAHAAYAMNAYFQTHGKNLEACSFRDTGVITNQDPSSGNCTYPG